MNEFTKEQQVWWEAYCSALKGGFNNAEGIADFAVESFKSRFGGNALKSKAEIAGKEQAEMLQPHDEVQNDE